LGTTHLTDAGDAGGGGGEGGGAVAVKLAAVLLAAFIVTTHVAPWPAQSPLHPVNANPAAGVAVRETVAPSRKFAEHELAQLIPAGALVTWPFAAVTLRLRVVTERNWAPLAPELSVATIVTTRVPGPAYA
jgi:hypothetical protein